VSAKATQRGVRHVMSTLWWSMGYHQGFLHKLWVICPNDDYAWRNGRSAEHVNERSGVTGCLSRFDAAFWQLSDSAQTTRRHASYEAAVGEIARRAAAVECAIGPVVGSTI
jgi:hypothetical protein